MHKARRRDLELNKYEISKNTYRSLLYYCADYFRVKQLINISYYPSTGSRSDYSPSKPINTVGDPVFQTYLKIEKMTRKIDFINDSATEADALIKDFIIANVVTGITYDQFTPERPPCNRRDFYTARRKFFWILAQKLEFI